MIPRPLLAALAAALAASTVGCDGWITVRGQVLAWENAPADAQSQVIVDAPLPAGAETSPLPGALAVVFTGLPDEASQTYADSVRTDADGAFEAQVHTAPFRHPFLVQVSRDGYRPAEVRPTYGEQKAFDVVVLLVPE